MYDCAAQHTTSWQLIKNADTFDYINGVNSH